MDTPAASCVLYPDLYPCVLISGAPGTGIESQEGWELQTGGSPCAWGVPVPPSSCTAGWQGDTPASRLFRKRLGTGLMIMNTWARFVFKVLYKQHLISPRGGAARFIITSVGSEPAVSAGRTCWLGRLPQVPPPSPAPGGEGLAVQPLLRILV